MSQQQQQQPREPGSLASREVSHRTATNHYDTSSIAAAIGGLISELEYGIHRQQHGDIGTATTAAIAQPSLPPTLEEQAKHARRKGITCILCGIKTHGIVSLNRVPLSTAHVYKGTCIKCYPSRIPVEILERYQRKIASAAAAVVAAATTESGTVEGTLDATATHAVYNREGEQKRGDGPQEDEHNSHGDISWTKGSYFSEEEPTSFQLVGGSAGSIATSGEDNKSTTLSWSVCSRIDQQPSTRGSNCDGDDDDRSVLTWEEFTMASEDPSLWGISYSQLMSVYYEAKDYYGTRFPNITMRDITQDFIVPLCNDTGTSYALHQNPAGLRADAFVSHSWDGPFSDFVDSIRKVFQCFASKPTLWICAFALVQGTDADCMKAQIGTEDPCLENSPFVAALKAAKKFVVVRNRKSDLYSRIWCVCELIFANKLGFVPDSTFVTGPDCFSSLHTSCMDARATNIEDKAKILRMLLEEHEYKEIDLFVNQFRCQDSPE